MKDYVENRNIDIHACIAIARVFYIKNGAICEKAEACHTLTCVGQAKAVNLEIV